ncbi:MAG TPA: hypothetical protein VF894_12870 [Anaeromyxobacter sp.]
MRRPVAALAVVLLAGCPPRKESPHTGLLDPVSCDTPLRETVLPSDMVEDLGMLAVGSMARFSVPTGTSSFLIFSQEAGSSAPPTVVASGITIPNAVVPTNLRAPDGTLYYDDFAAWPSTTIGGFSYFDVTGLLAFDYGFQRVSGGLPVPNTSAALDRMRAAGGLQPGTWTFTVNDWAYLCPFEGCADGHAASRYRVQVVTRGGGGSAPVPDTGTLEVEVYLATDVTSDLPTAAVADANAQVARWKQSLAAYLGNAGLTLGGVHFNDLPASVKERYAPAGRVDVTSTDPCGALGQLFTSATVQKRAVHVFLADALVAPTLGAFRVAGVDGSIPGPSGFPGTVYGGAVVGLPDFGFEASPGACAASGAPSLSTCGTDRVAYVTAHEIGHWLGLFHTTEQDGTLFDPISDTAPCPCEGCAAANKLAGCAETGIAKPTTFVTNDRCVASDSCGGGRNLMFWLLDDRYSTGELSSDQAQIVRLNPAVR